MHIVNPDIKIHTVVSSELDFDHEAAMMLPLGEVSDEQLLAEVARRRLDLHESQSSRKHTKSAKSSVTEHLEKSTWYNIVRLECNSHVKL